MPIGHYFHFLVMQKSWKIFFEKEWSTWLRKTALDRGKTYTYHVSCLVRFVRRWKRGYNSCSRTDLEFAPVVVPRRPHDDRLLSTTTATVKSCQSSIMSTSTGGHIHMGSGVHSGSGGGGHIHSVGRPAMSSSVGSSVSVVRDSRRLDLTKPRGSDGYSEARDLLTTLLGHPER